jgi:hypothetical protein
VNDARAWRHWLSLTGAVALVLAAQTARAAGATEPEAIRLVYRAPDYCPGVDAFVEEVRQAVPRFRLVEHDESARLFTVTLEAGPRGRLTIAKEGTIVGSRDVSGGSCEEVADILAFAVALAVDPHAVRPVARGANAAPVAPAGTTSDSVARVEPSTGEAPAAGSTKAPSGTPERSREPQSARESAPSPGERWWAISASALVASGRAPDAAIGGGASVDLGGRFGALAPSVRLGIEYSTSAPVSVDGAKVTLSVGALSLEACPTQANLGALSLRPCVRVDGGVRIATATDVPNGHTELRPWVDLGAMLHVRARVAGPLFVELGGGLLYAVTQDWVFLAPSIGVYTVPPVGGRGEAAVGVEFR